MRKSYCLLLGVLILAGLAGPARADVKLPAVFGSGMVLQRQMAVPVWGTADAGEKVTVSFAGQSAEATAGQDGQWKAELKAMEASATPQTLSVKGKNEVKFDNVLVGDVWVCSGQSNMEWSTGKGLVNKEAEIAAAKYPQIRLLLVKKATSTKPLTDIQGAWTECTPETMPGFSAVAYFFARELNKTLGVPIGLIGTYWGGTPAQAWTSREALAADPQLAETYLASWEKYTATFPQAKERFAAQLAAWKKAAAEAKKAGKPAPRAPRLNDPETAPSRPANLYNAMIAPLIPYGIKGAIWYQGEANAGSPASAALYNKLFSTMITDWRSHWGEGDFPFLFVQLANYMQRQEQPSDSSWAMLRESQLKTLSLKNTGMAVIIDVGDANNIHPQDKQTPGHRLALAAEKIAYGMDVVYSGPVFEKMEVKDGQAVLSFKDVDGGLVNKAEGGVKGFAVAGADKKFVWADAKIEGDKVVVSSPQVKEPVAVRYAWADNPEASLYNKANLPATPFRTDEWAAENLPAAKRPAAAVKGGTAGKGKGGKGGKAPRRAKQPAGVQQ